jgi:hypothetical protein
LTSPPEYIAKCPTEVSARYDAEKEKGYLRFQLSKPPKKGNIYPRTQNLLPKGDSYPP